MFDAITALKRLPHIGEMVAYWQDDETKISLLEVIKLLEKDYVSLIKKSYPSILDLQGFSHVQGIRIKNLGLKKLKPEVFLKNSSYQTNKFLATSKKLQSDFEASQKDFEAILDKIHKSLKSIETQLSEVEDKIKESEEKYKEAIAALIGSIIATLFAIAALAVAFGFFPGIAVALNTVEMLGLGAAAAGGVIGTAVSSMTLADLSETIGKLKNVKDELTKTADQLRKVDPLFTKLVGGVASLTQVWDGVTRNLTMMKDDQDSIASLRDIKPEDANDIAATWDEIGDSCVAWLDVINGQGITPDDA